MTRKIFVNAFLLGALVLMVCAVLFFGVQYRQTVDETYQALKDETRYAAIGAAIGGLDYLEKLEGINRVTWIAADGSVLYDSEYHDLKANQGDYPEVKSAFTSGEGRGTRKSNSGGVNTMYYAFLCADGTVLRLSRPKSAARYAILSVAPVLWVFLLVLIVSGAIAFRVAKLILKPVNELDLDAPELGNAYPELSPLIKRIQEQKETILRENTVRENMRKEFFANVSHELKTPLTSISGFAELMRDGFVPQEKVAEFSGDIYRESQRLISLVDDILRLSKLDEEQGFPEPEMVDLYDVSQEIINSLAHYARKLKVSLTLKGERAQTRCVYQVAREMIYNLVDNAIKYNRDGGTVTVWVKQEGDKTCVSVADTGIGIPKADQERVFERFYRVDKSHSKQIGGTGLGLSIVKHGAELHQAQVHLESQEGVGTTVTLSFSGEAD